jgi:hypothetical protein
MAARGEVIVSAGVYGSPQMLQLSGVGPGRICNDWEFLFRPNCRWSGAICSTIKDGHFL